MVIHNREIRFAFTVGASEDLAAISPNNDFTRLMEVLEQESYAPKMAAVRQFICILARAFDEKAAYENPGHVAQGLTPEELRTLDPAEIKALMLEAMMAIKTDRRTTVEVEPEKK